MTARPLPLSAQDVTAVMGDRGREIITRHLAALEDDARAFEATASLFRPEFDACWDRGADGRSMGPIRDTERALQLRPLVLDGPRSAAHNRELATAIRALLAHATIDTPAPDCAREGETEGGDHV